MSRKTKIVTVAALAAATTFTIASAEISGANARQGDDTRILQPQLTDETVPVFVSEEVVQPLSETVEQPDTVTTEAAPKASSLRQLVADISASETLSREMECLAGAIYFESRGEPLAGQLAVAQVVINRAESRVFPSSYCGVVHQRAQFSFVKNGRMPRIRRGSVAWKKARKIARIAHEGMWESEAADSLYFHAKYVRPNWSRKKTARATINTHIFYR